MKFLLAPRPVALLLGLSMCGLTGYFVYHYLKNDEDDDDNDSFYAKPSTKSNFKVIEIPIPHHMVRVLIGRNGTTIRSLEKRTNTRIKFKDVNSSTDSICVVRGSKESCVLAEHMIYDLIAAEGTLECADMWIPSCDAGKVIGRMGERIMEIKSVSGAKVDVERKEAGANAALRRVVIRGTTEQIALAKSLIEDVVRQSEMQRATIDSTLARREPRGPLRSATPRLSTENCARNERISPVPGQGDAQFQVYVSALVNPSHFWLQIVGEKATELDQLVEEMTEFYAREVNRENHTLTGGVNVGDLVAATFSFDNKWYRTEVLNVIENSADDTHVELFYADYGDTDVVPAKEVYELRTDFLRLPFQAIECYLARVEPLGPNWSDEAILRFEELTHLAQWKKLSARLNGSCNKEKTRAKREGSPVPGIDLFDVIDDRDVDIAQEMVDGGFATFKKDVDLKSASSRATSNSSMDSVT